MKIKNLKIFHKGVNIKSIFQSGGLNKNKQEIFVVIIMSYFGDALVGNSLFQNIKNIYPNSKTVFIINKPYYEVAKYQKDVDEVIPFDKNGEHKGLSGMLRFVTQFPYKNIKYIFKMCKKPRVDLLSLLLHPQKIINYNDDINIPSQERYTNLLKQVTNEKIVNYPIVYNASNNIPDKFKNIFKNESKYVALCTVSSCLAKDMPVKTAVELIDKLKKDNFEVIFVGVGSVAAEYASELQNNNCKFINLVGNTTIYELAQVLRNCTGLISVDTGTMHLGYANGVPTVCLFYIQSHIKGWAPDSIIYPHTILPSDLSSESIYDAFIEITKKNKLLRS